MRVERENEEVKRNVAFIQFSVCVPRTFGEYCTFVKYLVDLLSLYPVSFNVCGFFVSNCCQDRWLIKK